jgi:hypothetical protein
VILLWRVANVLTLSASDVFYHREKIPLRGDAFAMKFPRVSVGYHSQKSQFPAA